MKKITVYVSVLLGEERGGKKKNLHLVIICLLPWENPHHPARALGQEPPTIEVLGMIFGFLVLSKYYVKYVTITFEKKK